jgi:hypothetical protein
MSVTSSSKRISANCSAVGTDERETFRSKTKPSGCHFECPTETRMVRTPALRSRADRWKKHSHGSSSTKTTVGRRGLCGTGRSDVALIRNTEHYGALKAPDHECHPLDADRCNKWSTGGASNRREFGLRMPHPLYEWQLGCRTPIRPGRGSSALRVDCGRGGVLSGAPSTSQTRDDCTYFTD